MSDIDSVVYYNLKMKSEDLSRRAFPRPEKDVKYENKIAKEMMETYGKQYNQPIVRNGVEYKYHELVDAPDLDNLGKIDNTKTVLFQRLEEAKTLLNDYENEYIEKNDAYDKQIDELKSLFLVDVKKVNAEYDNNLKQINDELEKTIQKLPNITGRINNLAISRLNDKKNETIRRQDELFNEAMKNMKLNLDMAIAEIEKEREINNMAMDSDMSALRFQIENNFPLALNELDNEKKIAIKENKEKINKYREVLNLMNTGAFKFEQDINETEEDYLRRIQETAQTPYSDELKFLSVMNNLENLKKNFKDITRNGSLIESIINSLTDEDKYLVNKYWGDIRKNLLNTYGYNNKSIDTEDILGVIDKYLGSRSSVLGPEPGINAEPLERDIIVDEFGEVQDVVDDDEKIIRETTSSVLQEMVGKISEEEPLFMIDPEKGYMFEEEPLELSFLEAPQGIKPSETKKFLRIETVEPGNIIKIINNSTLKEFFIKLASISGKIERYDVVVGSFTGNIESFKVIKFEDNNYTTKQDIKPIEIKEIAKYLNVAVSDLLKEVFDNARNSRTAFNYLKNSYKLVENIRTFGKNETKQATISNNYSGWGINKTTPEIVKFGNVNILLDKLYTKNILSVKDRKNYNIKGFVNKKVSEPFILLIQKILKGDRIRTHDINILPGDEPEIFDNLLYLSGLSVENDIPNNFNENINKIKNRLELVEGQIQAGNNNLDLLKELKLLLKKLVNYNVISNTAMKKHIDIIENDFF